MQSRRAFIKFSLAGFGSMCLPLLDSRAFAQVAVADLDPHFYFQFFVQGGMDPTYTFDARPLDMKAKGLMQNYLNAEPTRWDEITLATSIVEPLKNYRQDFTILNGVVMSTAFQGHDQNTNILLAGDPFGGESFVAHLNTYGSQKKAPLDGIESGFTFASVTNGSKTVPLTAASLDEVNKRLGLATASPLKSKIDTFLNSRYAAIGKSGGTFAQTTHDLQVSYAGVPELSQLLMNVKIDLKETRPDVAFFNLALSLFKQGVARSAFFSVPSVTKANVDAHAPDDCKKIPTLYPDILTSFANLMSTLKTTPYDDKRSFMDVTTFMGATEFSRTMKQKASGVDDTGTDHNPLSNTLLIGGKGIRCGQVIGSSDRATADEKVSKVHADLDSDGLTIMGRPFDFATGKSRTDLPTTLKNSDYLGVNSVINTIYSLYGVPADRYRILARNESVAPIVKQLLV